MSVAALDLAARGLAVFPIPLGVRRPARGWRAVATSTPSEVRERFLVDDNVGVACRASRVVVFDLDRHGDGPDGVAGWDVLCAMQGRRRPETFTVATPRGGLHAYFRVPEGVVITSSSGRRRGLPPGIDVRAPGRSSGGYVVGPGSTTGRGRYTVAVDVPILRAPWWLLNVLGGEAAWSRSA